MPKHSRPSVRRVEITFPHELIDLIENLAGDRGRNAWIVGVCAKAAKVRLGPDQINPKPGPKGPRKKGSDL